ncbi:MAG: SDR family oxidoreductase [Massilia sp.]
MIKAIVTGHSKGLGAAIAADLLERGAQVLGMSRSVGYAGAPAGLTEVSLDMADTAGLAFWLGGDTLRNWLADASVVYLINNAGTVQPVGPLASQDPAAVARAVTINVAAPLMLSAAVVQALPPGASCRIVHISSGAGRNAYPGWSVYCATKAALDLHASAAAQDENGDVRIVSLAPGVIDTDMQGEIRATPIEQFPLRQRFDALKQTGELAAPPRVARQLIDFLMSKDFGRDAVADLRQLKAVRK